MKKFLTLAAAAGLAISANAELQTLKLSNKQLCTADGEAIQLKGFSTFSIHFNDGTACISDMHFDAMHQFGANVVRLAVYVDDPNDGGAYLVNPSKFDEKVKNLIEMAINNGMYCVVDWHILETGQNSMPNPGDPNTYKSEAIKFFKTISSYVASNPKFKGRVMYELCNEPSLGVTFAGNIKPYAEAVMSEIIKNDDGALCIIGTEGWCQKVLEATKNPVDAKYRDHALYSFHYYACSHENLIGDFQQAAANAPVIVSEWSTVNFTGDGSHCGSASDKLMAVCGTSDKDGRQKVAGQNAGKQLISWFFWNWGKKNEGSTVFAGNCNDPANSKKSVPGEYILKILGGGSIAPIKEAEGYGQPNLIPSNAQNPFDWMSYDLGGEGVAYHDGDGAAYDKDKKTGYYSGYKSGGDEVDALSEGRNRESGKTSKLGLNTNFTYGDGDHSLPTNWANKDAVCWDFSWDNGGSCKKEGYKTLNAGLGYCKDINFFPDEKLVIAGEETAESIPNGRAYGGVDVSKCSGKLKGTGSLKDAIDEYIYGNICSVEPGEWIRYTVKVARAGYYKVHYMASGQTKEASLGISLNDPDNGGNIIRNFEAKDSIDNLSELYTAPGDGLGATDYENWIWQQTYDLGTGSKEVGVVFREAGTQSITITFNEENGNTGPLYFELVDEDVTPEIIAQEASVYAESAIAVYPNPTSGEFTVALGTSEAAQVSVINMAGQVVYTEAVEGVENVTISEKLSAGIYNVVVATEFGVKSTKLQVK